MITKSLITGFIIFVIYVFGIPILMPHKQIRQHQWQGNRINAQNFIYGNTDTINSVIVGSSLSARIVTDSLHGFANLSFSGQSVYDGLEILSQKKQLPKYVYIETNTLLRERDMEFLSALFNQYTFLSQTLFPGLRAGREPLAIAGAALSKLFIMISSHYENRKEAGKNLMLSGRHQEDPVFEKLLSDQVKFYSNAPDSLALQAAILNMKYFVERLKRENVIIIFFEMPVNSNLTALPFSRIVRQSVYKAFPPNSFLYIHQPPVGAYITTDGIHLTASEALKYTMYFKEKITCHYCL